MSDITEEDLKHILIASMRAAFRSQDLSFEAQRNLRDYFGLDSVLFVSLILDIEARIGVLLPELEVERIETVNDLYLIMKKSVAMTD